MGLGFDGNHSVEAPQLSDGFTAGEKLAGGAGEAVDVNHAFFGDVGGQGGLHMRVIQ